MVVGAKVCELTDGFLWFVCGLYVGILTSPLMTALFPIWKEDYKEPVISSGEGEGYTMAKSRV